MDLHIEELLTQYRCITSGVNYADVSHGPKFKLHMSEVTAAAFLGKIQEEGEEESEEDVVYNEGRREDSKVD